MQVDDWLIPAVKPKHHTVVVKTRKLPLFLLNTVDQRLFMWRLTGIRWQKGLTSYQVEIAFCRRLEDLYLAVGDDIERFRVYPRVNFCNLLRLLWLLLWSEKVLRTPTITKEKPNCP